MSVDITRPRSSSAPPANGESGVEPPVYDGYGQAPPAAGPFSGGYAPEQLAPVVGRPDLPRRDHDRPVRRHRHAVPTKSEELIANHGVRLSKFSVIGGVIFLAGLAIQAVLTGILHVPSFLSYVVQAVVSIEASFMLNRHYTWRQRSTPFWSALLRFNVQKTITVAANLVLYAGLLKLGVNYLLANVLLTVVFTIVNYVGGDRFVFTPGGSNTEVSQPSVFGVQTIPFRTIPATRMPTVSVVIPCRANEKTIRATVDSLLTQDYPALREIVLVGSPDDTTWAALAGVVDRRVIINETETPPGIRDANFKRDRGIRETTSDLIALVDSDMVLPHSWLSRAVTAVVSTKADCVAGVMRSYHDDFWGRFVDNCRLGAKTPRVKDAYFVAAQDFGARTNKPPITANILFTREMYNRCPIDSSWSHGSLEDYEWFWRVVRGGHRVLVTDRLFGWHHHREGLSKLSSEYRRSARGCAYFIRAHGQSPFARKRLMQAITLPLVTVLLLASVGAAVATGYEVQAAVLAVTLGLTAVTVLCVREFSNSRTFESLAYPLPALILGLSYTVSLIAHLIRSTSATAMITLHTNSYSNSTSVRHKIQVPRRSPLTYVVQPLTLILALQAAFSLSLIWSNTAFSDEADYLWVGRTLIGHLMHGTAWPSVYAHSTLSGLPFIYPPLGAAANMAGGLAGARMLSLVFMLCATALVYSMALQLFDRKAAIFAAALWAVFSPTIQLGAFATYDALSVFLTACAAWIVVQTRYRRHRGELVAASAIMLAVANLAAYSGIVMIPVVLGFAFLIWVPAMGFKQAAFCATWLISACTLTFCVVMTVSKSWQGILTTVLARNATSINGANGYASPAHIFNDSWTYSGIVAILALIGGVFAASSHKRLHAIQVAYLAAIALVIPLAQIHETTAVSLKKHLAYGAIFATMAAGYGLSKLSNALPAQRFAAASCCSLAFIFPAVSGIQSAESWYRTWPDENSLLAKLTPMLSSNPTLTTSLGNAGYLCKYYYAPKGSDWEKCQSNLTIRAAREGTPQIIVMGYPASVTPPSRLPAHLLLSPATTQRQFLAFLSQDTTANAIQNPELAELTTILETGHQYRLVATGPYDSDQSTAIYAIWQRTKA